MESNVFDSKEVQECLAKILDSAIASTPELLTRLTEVKANKANNNSK